MLYPTNKEILLEVIMTEEKILKRLKETHDDKDKIKKLFKDSKTIAAKNIVSKVTSNRDYHPAIAVSRVTYQIPIVRSPFDNLLYIQKRRILFMLRDALESYILTLPLQKVEAQ